MRYWEKQKSGLITTFLRCSVLVIILVNLLPRTKLTTIIITDQPPMLGPLLPPDPPEPPDFPVVLLYA